MTPERYQQLQQIFLRACEIAPAERTDFIHGACGADLELEEELRRLLRHDREPPGLAQSADLRGQIESLFSDLCAATPAELPAHIGRYRIIRLIGAGGMGHVYEAEQDHPRRRVALKVMRGGLPGAPLDNLQRRFHQEANALAKLQHPAIAQIYDAGAARIGATDLPYFAMELIDGTPLGDFAEKGKMSLRQRLALVADLADAVHYAHTRGVIHRDLKPGNILVTARKDQPSSAPGALAPKILDFGIARIVDAERGATTQTELGQIIGTLAYMSPEQVAGDAAAIDPRCDVYALGVILYELLSGAKPLDLDSKSFLQAVRAIQELEPARLSFGKLWDGTPGRALRGDVETIVAKALQKDRNQRYASAAQLADDIRRHLNHEPISARPATALYQLRKFARRNRALSAVVLVAGVVLLVASVVTSYLALSESRLRHIADDNSQRASQNEQRAIAGETTARRNAYRLAIAAAQATLDDPARARQRLTDAPVEYRNWEWKYLRHRVDPSIAAAATPRGTVPAGQFLSDGTAVAALPGEEKLRFIRLDTGQLLFDTPIASGAATQWLTVGSDGHRMAWFDPDSEHLITWDPPAAPIRRSKSPSGVIQIEFDATLTRAVVLTPTELSVVDLNSGAILLQRTSELGHEFERIALSGDGGEVASTRFNGLGRELSVIDIATQTEIARAFTTALVGSLAIDSRRRQLVFADNFRRFHRLAFPGDKAVPAGASPSFELATLAESPHGRHFAAAAPDERVFLLDAEALSAQLVGGMPARRVWVADDGRVLAAGDGVIHLYAPEPEAPLTGHTSYVYCIAVSPHCDQVASAAWDRTVRIWDSRSGALLRTLEPYQMFEATGEIQPSGLWYRPDGTELHVRFNATPPFIGWHCPDFERLPAQESADVPPGATLVPWFYGHRRAISHDGQFIADAVSTSLNLKNAHTNAVLKTFRPSAFGVNAVAISPHDERLAFATDDGTIWLYDIESGRELTHRAAHLGRIHCLAFTSDGSRLASGGDDSVIQISDADTLEMQLALRGHTSYVHALAFAPDDSVLVSGSGDKTVRLWSADIPEADAKQISRTVKE